MEALRWLMRHRLLLVAAIAVTALAVVACDDDDDDDGGDGGGQLRIGYLADFSGALAEFGPEIQTGVELAIQHINEGGGVNGQAVVLVVGDTQLDQTAALEEARRLVDVEGVDAIVGPLASTITIAVAESVTGPAGIPTISPSATSPAVTGANDDGYLFRSVISDAAQSVVLAQLAEDEGYDNLGVLYLNDAYGQGLSDGLAANFSGTVTSASHEDGQATYLSELQAAAEGDADVLVAISFPTQAEVYLRESLENGIFDQFLFVDGTKSEELIDAIGADNLEGFKGTAPGGGPESESLTAWNAAYLEEHDALPSRPFVREAYDAVIAIALAAESAGSTDGTAIRDALVDVASPGGEAVIPGAESIANGLELVRDGEDVNYEGAATTLDWNEVGDVTTGFVGIWQYAGGEIVELEAVPFNLEN